uniref:Uncharacterized protein n=1 Tax=Salmo trutta TaxID=8032 RepID=A0A674EEN9_SALTR
MIKLFLHNLCDIAGVPAIPDPRSVLDYFSDVFKTKVLGQGWESLMGVGGHQKSDLIMRGRSGSWVYPFGGPNTDKCIEDYKNYITYFTMSLPAEPLELILRGDPFLVEDLE